MTPRTFSRARAAFDREWPRDDAQAIVASEHPVIQAMDWLVSGVRPDGVKDREDSA